MAEVLPLTGLADREASYIWLLTSPGITGRVHAGLLDFGGAVFFLHMVAEEGAKPTLHFTSPCCGSFVMISNLAACRKCGQTFDLHGDDMIMLSHVVFGEEMQFGYWLDAHDWDPLRSILTGEILTRWEHEIEPPVEPLPFLAQQHRATRTLEKAARIALELE